VSLFSLKKGQKKNFKIWDLSSLRKKMLYLETHFFAISIVQKDMGGLPIGFWEKSIFFGSIVSQKITIFVQQWGYQNTPLW